MNKKAKKISICLFSILLVFCSSMNVFALGGKFSPEIKSISETNNNNTYAKMTNKEIKGSVNAEISTEFQRPNDEISYNIVIKNIGEKYGTLKDINISSKNKDISYEVSGTKVGDVLKEKSEVILNIKAKATSTNLKKSTDKVIISLTYEDQNGNTVIVEDNPNTIDNIVKYFITLIISLILVILIIVILKKSKDNNKNIKFIIIMILILTYQLDTKALTGTIKINMNVTINPIEVWDGTVSEACFKEGKGTSDSPYTIENGQDLACFAKSVNDGNTYEGKYVALTKDIILNENVISNDNLNENNSSFKEWIPAGNNYDVFFSGTFDGNNHFINGIYINDSNVYKGLFGVTKNAKISDLKINDSYINGAAYISEVIGYAMNDITLENIETNGIINASSMAGGMIGSSTNNNSKIQIMNCVNESKVKGSSNIGGFIGQAAAIESIKIENSHNLGNIEGSSSAGGIIGYITSCKTTTLENVYNRGNIETSSIYAGGIIGSMNSSDGKIVNAYNTGRINGSNGVGGIIGNSYSALELINTYNKGEISGNSSRIGGIVGYSQGIQIKDSYNIGNVIGNGSSSTVAGIIGEAREANIDNCYNKGLISGATQTAGIAGRVEKGNINNVYNTGEINGRNIYIGGIVGQLDQNATIENSYNTGNVIGNEKSIMVGGITGFVLGNVKKSYNLGKIEGNNQVGGISGMSLGSIEDSYNRADVSGYINVGGLVGLNGRKTIKNSYNTGSVIGTYEVGGITGQLGTSSESSPKQAKIINTFNSGNINIKYDENKPTNEARSFGGISGFSNISDSTEILLENNYNLGKITLDAEYNNLSANIDYYMGGLFGKIENIKDNNVINNYYIYGNKGTGLCNLDADFTKKISISEVPNLLLIINSNNSFKEDTDNINNGYPILK